jgi:hypothetical protein
MATISVYSDKFFYALAKKEIDLSSDSVKILLMKAGFIFDPAKHRMKKNIKGTITGSSNISFTASTKKITKATGGFTAAGFIPTNTITVSGTTNNNGTKTIVTVSDTEIVVSETVVDESNQSATITADDEIAASGGYSKDTLTTGTITVAEDNVNHRMSATFADKTITASGGSVGPARGALYYDDTTSDDTIIGFSDFQTDVTITDGNSIYLENQEFRLSNA